jgi:hypothetical protein
MAIYVVPDFKFYHILDNLPLTDHFIYCLFFFIYQTVCDLRKQAINSAAIVFYTIKDQTPLMQSEIQLLFTI